ncbi:MAG TPA: putative DNA modification/repair radical SAM protein [Spirochaetia bacterium]|nr:putative DNA modification/repair radical SAM protein [Spirochaetia bacterium]
MILEEKLKILAGAARYDAACAPSGGDTPGVCHAWSDDGRAVCLLKVLFTNSCLYDCAYCANRRSNPTSRAAFTIQEVVDLTLDFYRRNFVDGLFLSSGVFRSPDNTMEALATVARRLRTEGEFRGYIHLKAIPGADPALVREAGLWADRLSVNIELPSRTALAALAPDKSPEAIFRPMRQIAGETKNALAVAGHHRSPVPRFAPAGQTTQMIVGASPETDLDILQISSKLYSSYGLKRVYYSAYVPVNDDCRLPALGGPPLRREHRLYQSDWLHRFYGFQPEELLDPGRPWLDEDLDPKAGWALRHPEVFPVDINRAPGSLLLRVPGLGPWTLKKVLAARRRSRLRREDLKVLGAVVRRAGPFLRFEGEGVLPRIPEAELRLLLAEPAFRQRQAPDTGPRQGVLF